MGEQAEKCRRKAVECESSAVHSPDEAMRLAYLELAHLWRQIAAQAETLDRIGGVARPCRVGRRLREGVSLYASANVVTLATRSKEVLRAEL